MDLTSLVLDISEAVVKIYSIICNKPYVTAEVVYVPQKGKSGEVTKEEIAFTIINEGELEIEVQRIWFLTSFNRPIFSKYVDSKMPIKVRRKDRATYFVPIEEFKAALNKSFRETIVKTAVLDNMEHTHIGRIDKVTQEELAK